MPPPAGDAAGKLSPARVLVTLAAVLVAALVSLLLLPWIPHTQFVLFYGVVALAAAWGGLPLAIVAILASLAVAEAVLGPPGLPRLSPALILRLAMLGGVSFGVAYLVDSFRRARRVAEANATEVGRLADRLAEQAEELELQVTESETMAAALEEVNEQLTEQRDAASRLHELGMRARIRAEFAERRLGFLSEASARLSETLDYEAALDAVARMCVPEIADCVVIHLIDDAGVPRLAAAAHVDAALVESCIGMEARHALATIVGDVPDVIESGGAIRVDITEALLEERARDADHLDGLRTLGLASQIVAPIFVDGRVRGLIAAGSGESGRTFDDADVTLVAELGRRAGHAVQNARLYQAARFASNAKSDFLAVISHELRTPLNAIIGYTDLLLLGIPSNLPDQSRRQVERIRSASDGLLHLVDEVLSFSRLEAGKDELRISPLDLTALLRECVALVEPMAAAKSLALRLDVPEEPLKLVSDERKIRQILANLLSNAVKFTEEGGIHVRAAHDDTMLRVEVADTGIGIPEEHFEHIFDPFWQVEHASTRRYGGTGLGLGVARKLANLLNGRLLVKSGVGAGSVFTLHLPVRLPVARRAAATTPA
ncbi:MAG TPA: ATP-binding protein [Longimicrobiales bacterium]|nr:ATP-binding protein [Longimicrobiales bacterium]